MASGDTKTEQMLNVLANGGDASQFSGCCNTKTQNYILGAIDRVQSVEDEVEELKNNPDVVDIVDTYADLQAYDTQHLTENDIIRVLQDETHSGNSTYYRFTKNPDTWTFIGEISGGGGVTPVQTTGASTTDVMSQDATTHMVYSEANPSTSAQGGAIYLGNLDTNQVQQADPATANRGWKYFWALPSSNTSKPINNSVCILGDIPYQTTGVAIGSTVAFGCKVLGSGGVAIGPDAEASQNSVAIGFMANASRDNTNNSSVIAIGSSAEATADYSICIGGGGSSYGVQNSASTSSITLGYKSAISGYKNSVALGAYSEATRQGEVNVGLVKDETTGGYNNTAYRVIGGVHDPVDAHDAATKGYVDSHAGGNAGAVLYTDMNNIPAPGSQVSNVAMYKDATLSTPYTVSQAITDLSNSGNKLTLFLSDGSGDDLQAYHFTYVHLSGSPNAGTASFDANVFDTMQNSILYIDGDQSSNEFSLQNTQYSS